MSEPMNNLDTWNTRRWGDDTISTDTLPPVRPSRARCNKAHTLSGLAHVFDSLAGLRMDVLLAALVVLSFLTALANLAALRWRAAPPPAQAVILPAGALESSTANERPPGQLLPTPAASPTPTATLTPLPPGDACVTCVPDRMPFLRGTRYLCLTYRWHDPKRPRHIGIDISVEAKMEVIATMDGLVTHAAYDAVYGNLVILSNEHWETWYAHNSYLLVQEGDYVYAGDVIALSGNTGDSSGPHLHYEVHEDGIARDPWLYLGEDAVRIATDTCANDEPAETDEPSR